jgi:hypothetical protein
MCDGLSHDVRQKRIRALNDKLRRTGHGGMLVVTAGVAALSKHRVRDVVAAVAGFDAFTPYNDPHGEHDFCSLTVGGERVLFKIDYYDASLSGHSPDAADERLTARVLTIMLAGEY